MAYNAGEAFPDSIVLSLTTSAAVTKGTFVQAAKATGAVAPYTGAAAPTGVVGVALDAAAASGAEIRVVVKGKATVTADSTGIKAGAFVSANTDSKAEAATTNTDFVLGFEVEDAGASGVALVYLPGTPMNIDTNT